MARTKTNVVEKKINVNLKVLNVKIRSNDRRGESVYSDIVKKLKSDRIKVKTFGDYHLMLRTQYVNENVIHGSILKFIQLDDKWFNEETMEYQTIDIDGNLHPNTKETDYYFFPKIHKFCFSAVAGFSENHILKFLTEGLKNIINDGESVDIDIIKSNDGFEMIYNAFRVTKLDINISYTNNELTPNFAALWDDEMKDNGVGSVRLEAKADINNNITFIDSKLLKGALDLAKGNGTAKAIVYNDQQEKIVVNTDDYPLKLKGVTTENRKLAYIRELVTSAFNRGRNG